MIRAEREGFRIVRALGLPLTPLRLELIGWLPVSLSVAVARKILNTEFAKITMAGHASTAPEEMKQLADEFRALIERTSVPTPAIDELR